MILSIFLPIGQVVSNLNPLLNYYYHYLWIGAYKLRIRREKMWVLERSLKSDILRF